MSDSITGGAGLQNVVRGIGPCLASQRHGWGRTAGGAGLQDVVRGIGPCLVSHSVTGGAGLQDVVRGLWACATRALVCVENGQFDEVGEELAASCFHLEDAGSAVDKGITQ